MKTSVFLIFSALIIGAFSEITIPIGDLPLPKLDDFEVIKKRCDEKGGEGAYDKVKEAKTEFEKCTKDMFNVTQIQLDLEEKAKTGSMDEVFNRECQKRPQIRQCVNDLLDAVKPCLEDTEKDALNLTLNVVEQLGDFACGHHGDRLAMFVAEGGIECLRDHSDGIQKCVETTYNIDTTSIPDTNALPSFVIDKEKCDDMARLQTCVVEELEKCEETTPANIIDALFRFVKRTVCTDKLRKRSIFKRSSMTESFNYNEAVLEKILNNYKAQCEKYGTSTSYTTLETKYTESRNCVRSMQTTMMINFERNSNYKSTLENCMTPTLDAMKDCLPENQKFLPDFYMEMLYSLTDFLVESKEKVQSASFTREMVNCFQTIRGSEANLQKLRQCAQKYEIENDEVDKEKVCSMLSDIKDCFSTEIDNICIRDITVQEYKNDFLNAFYKPCLDE